jgi:hypothetical protein
VEAQWSTITNIVCCSVFSYFINECDNQKILLEDKYNNDDEYTNEEFNHDIKKNLLTRLKSLLYYDAIVISIGLYQYMYR